MQTGVKEIDEDEMHEFSETRKKKENYLPNTQMNSLDENAETGIELLKNVKY